MNCIYCNKPLNFDATLNDVTKPTPGEIIVCCECAGVLIFKEDLTLKKFTKADFIAFMKDDPPNGLKLAVIRNFIISAIKEHNKLN